MREGETAVSFLVLECDSLIERNFTLYMWVDLGF